MILVKIMDHVLRLICAIVLELDTREINVKFLFVIHLVNMMVHALLQVIVIVMELVTPEINAIFQFVTLVVRMVVTVLVQMIVIVVKLVVILEIYVKIGNVLDMHQAVVQTM
jgi:hypothetical protein